MAKKMLIDATHAEETRVVVVDGNKVEEFDFESENKRQLAGNIYLAKVTRVEPSLQAAFVDYGGNRHGFLAFSEIHPDYYQIPVADRQALMEEEAALAAEEDEDDKEKSRSKNSRSRTRRSRSRSKAEKASTGDKLVTGEVSGEVSEGISGMETIDLGDDVLDARDDEGLSPMETVAETPVEEPAAAEADETELKAPEEAPEADDHDDHVHELDAAKSDDSIESVADDDTEEDIRPARKPRARKYKIQEVIKVRQILLVQVVKEERGNKGAALTTYLSLAGRYCVLMPNTARGGGISRKITNAADRSKLKEIAQSIDVPKGAGLIIRTAGAKRTKTEIKRDYEYLQRLWEQIRELTLKSVAPAKIYEEGDLIKRSIRDLYNREIDEVHVEGERGYRNAKDFMKMIMPSHAKNVKHYLDPMPLFARYQVESYLGGMFNPTVQLKSGGYIVIGVTEALVAIDVNSGRATKEGSIEETALKTNLEAAEEVARQLRLRDLAGLIVIDFIDMEERKNNAAVEKKLKDKLKTDRARIQVGRISGFGLLEMSRQRLRPGMIEATTQPCAACHGTGLIRSDDNMALNILRQIEEEGVRRRSREVLVKCPVGIANYLMNQKREHVAQIEARYGVDRQVVLAIWGMESAYGTHRGTHPVIPALATLAFGSRRGSFFEGQLIDALHIIQNGDTSPEHMTGSWAGAMGHTQFIPSSYRALAVDWTGDGKRDIWSDNPADALASTAHYLAENGWIHGQPWGVEVQLPRGFDYDLADSTTRMPSDWAKLGVVGMDGHPVQDFGSAKLLLPAGYKGAAFLTFKNFKVISRYNAADAYVIGVGHLADRIMGGAPIRSGWPDDERALTSEERKELQVRLKQAGFDPSGADGRIGPNTIKALREYQRAVGAVPDGYASLELLHRLR
uniref:Ribonuclease E n=1 Tax=Alloyangia mangrovi TaxID=1779329 RepID=A0A2A3JWB9_9RHOB